MTSRMTIDDDTVRYAQQRADTTGQPYLVSAMGHVMPSTTFTRRFAACDLGGVALIVRPKRRSTDER